MRLGLAMFKGRFAMRMWWWWADDALALLLRRGELGACGPRSQRYLRFGC